MLLGSKQYPQNQEIIESFLSIDIDPNINESSISKKYKWITSLQLISADQFRQKIFVKQKNHKNQDMVKHFQIDKLLYLVVTFCEEGKLPIARIRTRKQISDDEDWKIVAYPKQYESLFQHHICYQFTQSQECKRIITDIEVCHGKQFEDMNRSQDQWQIATIPEPVYRFSKIQRTTRSQSQESAESRSNVIQNIEFLNTKYSDRSQAKQNMSNLSENSYYSCNDHTSKSSIDKDPFSDVDQISTQNNPKQSQNRYSNETQEKNSKQQQSRNSNQQQSINSNDLHSKQSSITDFQSIEETQGPFYFIMKTIDLYDYHNQFQYTYEPKIIQIQKVNSHTNFQQKYLRSIAKFCFPNGIKLFKKINGCGFQTFTLILTTDEGQRYFAYCLKYKQKMNKQIQEQLLKELYQLHLIQKASYVKNRKIFNEKVFCFVSKIQNSDIFHKILQNLYRALLSFSSPEKGLEYFQNTKNEKQQRKLQFFAFDLINKLKAFSKSLYKIERRNTFDPIRTIPTSPMKNEEIQFNWCGVKTMFPKKQAENKVSMKALYCLFKLLTVENIVKILVATLLEKKIFVVSSIQSSILLVIEAMVGILHPLRLSQPIIPIISQELMDLIQAPIPLIAGIGQQLVNQYTMTKAVYVFLDCNKILALQQIPSLPVALGSLQKQLAKFQFYKAEHVVELINFKDEVYSFGIHQIQEYGKQIHEQIKFLLKESIVSLLKNYVCCFSKTAEQNIKKNNDSSLRTNQHSNQVQSQRISSKTNKNSQKSFKHLTFKQMYNTLKFIKVHQKKQHLFYEEFTKSSIFKNLIQQKYNNPHDEKVRMIDKAIQNLEEDIINHFSCLSIPVSSIKKQTLRHKKQTQMLTKTKNSFQKQTNQRGSLTAIKQQQMKKNLSLKQSQIQRKLMTVPRKAANINIKRDLKIVQNLSPQENPCFYSQRLSEGGIHSSQNRKDIKEEKLVSQYQVEPDRKSVGFKICNMVNNVTKKITDSKTNIVNIFSEAKVNRLKKVYIEENKDKNKKQQKQNQQKSVQNTENNLFHNLSPQITNKSKQKSIQMSQHIEKSSTKSKH